MTTNQSFVLQDVNTEILRKLLGISMSVTKSETLNFTLTNDKVVGIANNEADSIYKKWSIQLASLCTVPMTQDGTLQTIPELKCSIYKGEEFSKKILSYFGQFVNFKIEHNGSEIKRIELFKTNDKGVTTLKINLLTAASATAFIDYSKEFVDQIFTPDDTTKLVSFELDNDDLSTVSKLSRLSTNPEEQTNYVTIYTAGGTLKATDNAFDVILKEDIQIEIDPIEIDKSLWSMIDRDKYIVDVHTIEDNKILVCTSQTKNVIISLVLLGKTDDSVNFDDFTNDDKTFM